MRALAVACAVLLCASNASSQGEPRPDFSGRWVLVETAPRLLDQWTPAAELLVRQTATAMTVEHPAAPAAWPKAATHAFGSAGVIGGRGERTVSGALWLGDQLVFGTTRTGGPAPDGSRETTEAMETWSLDGNSRLVIEVTERQPGSARVTIQLRYEGRAAP